MSETLPVVYLVRHGETAWTLSGQHTGMTDLPLTKHGERAARQLGEELRGRQFARIFTSPLQRAARTCELAGFGDQSQVDHDLVNGTMANTRVSGPWRSTPSVPAGKSSVMVAPEGNRPARLAHGLIVCWSACARCSGMF